MAGLEWWREGGREAALQLLADAVNVTSEISKEKLVLFAVVALNEVLVCDAQFAPIRDLLQFW